MPVYPFRSGWLVLLVLWTSREVVSGGDPPGGEQNRPAAESAADSRDELRREVQRLIDELGAETRAARAQAEHELMQLGVAALPHLPPPDLLPDASVREAVRRVRITLERRKAQKSVQPSRVTLSGRFRLDEIVENIAKQTGNRIDVKAVPQANRLAVFEVDFHGTVFWSAIDELARPADLRLRPNGENRVMLVPESNDAREPLRVIYPGPSRVAVLAAELRPLPGDTRQLLRVQIGLRVEPRLRPLYLKLDPRDVAAAIPEMGMLRPFSPDASYEIPMSEGSGEVGVQLDYYAPEGAAVQKVSLQGRMMMLVAAGTEDIAFADPAGSIGVAKRRGGVTVSLEKAAFREEAAGGTAQIQVAVRYDAGGPAFESHRTWINRNRAMLRAAAGPPVEPKRVTPRMQADGAVVLAFDFEGLKHKPHEYEFTYFAPTLLIDVPIEIDLAAVPVRPRDGP